MKIRHLRIRINTENGPHGADINFPDGLVVLRADNTMGKSTCIQAILVALGLEATLTTSQRDLPLPPVMKQELYSDDEIVRVLESEIFLEIENKQQERIVVHRTVKGNLSKDLITVYYGPALTETKDYYESETFYVSRSGAATRERGFHRFLAEFLGWKLPEVQTYDGKDSVLYLQCIFPYFVVEQKRGWASLTPPIPPQFRIKDPHRRSIEFLLNLDASKIAAKRIELNARTKDVENSWTIAANEIQYLAGAIGGVVNNLPNKPIAHWPPEIPPVIQIHRQNEWITLDEFLQRNREELDALRKEEIPVVSTITDSANSELADAQEELNEKEVVVAKLLNSLELERGELRAVELRIEKVKEDIQRNKDAQTIASLGSIAPNVVRQICPTCHQPIGDTLLPLAEEQQVMSLDDNISFLEEQLRTFNASLKNAKKIVNARESQIIQLREELMSVRAKIRTIRETLVSDDRLPSMEAIRRRVELEENITRQKMSLEQFQVRLGKLEYYAEEWFFIQKEKESLPLEDTSTEDKNKLKIWNRAFMKQLRLYDFQSLPVDTVEISHDTYIPKHEGFDLPSNISASDFIRIIWAYLNGLLDVSREFDTNHPGFLIFDEPKQQSAKEISFSALLEKASEALKFDQQVIFATSEDRQVLKKIIQNIPHTLFDYQGRIIQPITQNS